MARYKITNPHDGLLDIVGGGPLPSRMEKGEVIEVELTDEEAAKYRNYYRPELIRKKPGPKPKNDDVETPVPAKAKPGPKPKAKPPKADASVEATETDAGQEEAAPEGDDEKSS
jgi:hypothetical protein